jgi:hypothetical protein
MAERADKVDVRGLREVQKMLRLGEPELAKALRVEQLEIAEDVLEKSRTTARSQGGVARKAAEALKAKAEQRYAKVILDGGRFPFVYGGEFGALRYQQFEPWRGNQYTDPLAQNVGYFLHPTLRAERDHIEDAYEQMVEDLLERLARVT